MTFSGNCPFSTLTAIPFGALFQPGLDQGGKNLQLVEKDGERWIGLKKNAEPLSWPDKGENVVSRWLWATSDGKPDLEIHGTWFVDGQPKQGLRAKSLLGKILITERAVRLGLSRPDVPGARKGPWIFSDRHGKVAEAVEGCMFGAALYFENIDWVRGGKTICAFGGDAGAVIMQARGVFFEGPGPRKGEKFPLGELAAAVTAGLIDSARESKDPARRVGAEGIASSNFASTFASSKDALVELVK
jgi:hypothetical protein